MVDGQKVPIKRTRLRSGDNREQRLGSYELFQRDGPLQHGVWDKMMRGLSTRNYGAVVKDFREAYGVEKSAVSDNFIEASREKVKQLMERPLGELRLCAVLIDGTPMPEGTSFFDESEAWDVIDYLQSLGVRVEDDGVVIAESIAILEYLEERHPTPALMPTDVTASLWE